MLRLLARDVAVYGAGDFALKFIGFAVFPIYAHVFTVEQFGVLALVMAATGILSLLSNVGLNNAVQRFYWDPDTAEQARPRLVTTGLIVLGVWSIVLTALLIGLLRPLRAELFARYEIDWTIAVLALLTIVPTQILQYAMDALRLRFAKGQYLFVSFLKNVLGVLIGVVLILGLGYGLEGFFWGAFAGAALALPIALFLIRSDLTPGFHRGHARQLLTFGYPFIFAGLAYWVFSSVDRWMLAELSDTTNVGWYSIAFKFATLIIFLNTAFGQAWSPLAIKLLRDDPAYRHTYSRLLSIWFFVLLLLGAGVAFFARELLMLTSPGEYWPAAAVLGVVVMGAVIAGTTQITALGISLERQTRLLSRAAWITAALNVLLNVVLIPRFGALGAGIATFLSYAVLSGLYLFWSQRLHPIPLERRNLAYCATLTLLVVPAAYVFGTRGVTPGIVLLKVLLLAAVLGGGLLLRIVRPALPLARFGWGAAAR